MSFSANVCPRGIFIKTPLKIPLGVSNTRFGGVGEGSTGPNRVYHTGHAPFVCPTHSSFVNLRPRPPLDGSFYEHRILKRLRIHIEAPASHLRIPQRVLIGRLCIRHCPAQPSRRQLASETAGGGDTASHRNNGGLLHRDFHDAPSSLFHAPLRPAHARSPAQLCGSRSTFHRGPLPPFF